MTENGTEEVKVGEMQELWKRFAAERAPEQRRKLIESYAPLARYVVDRLNLKPGPALSYDDLLSQAVVGLIDAVDRFDPSRGIKFETYAYYRVRGAVMDMLRDMDWVPRSVRQRESELSEAYARLERQHHRAPSDDEVAQELGISLPELDNMAQEVALQAMQSLDESLGSGEYETGTVADSVPDPESPSPEKHIEQWAEREMLAKAIERLPDSERTVVGLYYHDGLTLKEIGRVLGVTESRACQIHGKALVRLRALVKPMLEVQPAAPRMPRVAEAGLSSVRAQSGRWG